MISPLQIRAMRLSLMEKFATRTTEGDISEQMSGSRWKQTALDLPAVAIGAGLGYGAGRVLSEGMARTLLKSSPVAQQRFLKAAPYANVALSSMGAYALGRQREVMRSRRDEAEALSRTNSSVKQASGPLVRNHPSFARNDAQTERASGSARARLPDFYTDQAKAKDPGSTHADIPYRSGGEAAGRVG